MTISELRTKRATAWEATKAFLDSHRNDKGTLSAEDDATYSRMENEITDLGKEISRLDRLEVLHTERIHRMRLGTNELLPRQPIQERYCRGRRIPIAFPRR